MRTPVLNKKSCKAINQFLYTLSSKYHDSIPLGFIDFEMRANGCFLVQEDGTPWSGFLCGREARATFTVHNMNDQEVAHLLVMSWYKMPSGRYEINAYLS